MTQGRVLWIHYGKADKNTVSGGIVPCDQPERQRGQVFILDKKASSVKDEDLTPKLFSVRRPMRLRYPAVAEPLLSRAPSPDARLPYRYTLRHYLVGSGTCPPSHLHAMVSSPLRTRAVPGTQPVVPPDGWKLAGFERSLVLTMFLQLGSAS